MHPNFTHPLVLTVWSVAVATAALFAWLTLSNLMGYKTFRRNVLLVNGLFTAFSALQAATVALTFLPMSPMAKSIVFRLLWVFGAAGMAFWARSVAAFVGGKSRALVWISLLFLGLAGVVSLDILVSITTGQSAFYTLEPLPTDAFVYIATGNVVTYRWLAHAVSALVVVALLPTCVLLLRLVSNSKQRDRTLQIGILFTAGSIVTEIVLRALDSRYQFPIVFCANLIEAVRITSVSRIRMLQEVEEIRSAQYQQTVLLAYQLDGLLLNSRMAQLGEHTARLSHDIRNPLTNILGTLDLFEMELGSDPPDHIEMRELIGTMRISVDHLLTLVRRITGQARSEGEDALQTFSVREATDDAIALSQHRLDGRGCGHIHMHTSTEDDLHVLGRRTEFIQVLVNLIANACDAIEDLPDRWIRISAQKTQDELTLQVIDSGPRPPDDILDRMFVARFTTRPLGHGTGLGLAICARILEHHGGRIFVDRQARNTTVVMQLPAASARQRQHAA